jgi:hypothetical protein
MPSVLGFSLPTICIILRRICHLQFPGGIRNGPLPLGLELSEHDGYAGALSSRATSDRQGGIHPIAPLGRKDSLVEAGVFPRLAGNLDFVDYLGVARFSFCELNVLAQQTGRAAANLCGAGAGYIAFDGYIAAVCRDPGVDTAPGALGHAAAFNRLRIDNINWRLRHAAILLAPLTTGR